MTARITNMFFFLSLVVEHMSTYWSILEKLPGSKLRLTKYDDEILEHFNKEFPDFDLKATINEDDMKSKEGKEKWRNFINAYEKKIEDYNFGAMVRANPAFEYDEKGTIFGEWRRNCSVGICVVWVLLIIVFRSCSHAVLCD